MARVSLRSSPTAEEKRKDYPKFWKTVVERNYEMAMMVIDDLAFGLFKLSKESVLWRKQIVG